MEQLYQTIEQYTHIAPENQILITSYGNIVKTDNVQQVLQATGKDEYLVFCYNREWLSKKPAQMSDLLAKEFPKLQPEIVSFNGLGHLKQIGQQLNKKTVDENCEAYATLFKNLYSYSGSLMEGIQTHAKIASDTVEEQKMQTMALNVALENLNSHIGSGTRKVQAYLEVAKKELARQNGLLKSLNNDINILRHTSIHKAILDKLDNGDERLKLLDFVDLDRIGSIHTESKQLYNNLKKKSHELAKVTRELANHQKDLLDHVGKSSNLQSLDATLSDVKSIAKTAQECSDDISKSIPKVEDTINKLTSDSVSIAFSNMSLNTRRNSASSSPVSFSMAKKKFDSLNHLAIYQFDDPIYKLVKYDTIMRQNVSNLIKSKYSSISEFFLNMSIVSGIQDCIVEMEHDTAEELDRLNLFKKKYGKNDLESVRQVAFAYGALLIELVRRREYKNIIVKNSNLLADLLSDYRSVEEKRREQFKRIVSKSLPFRFADLDKPSPQSEVNLNLVKDHNETTLEKGDITEFISLLNTVYVQPVSVSPSKKPSFATVTSPKRSIHSNRIEENPILVFLNAMFTQMNDLKSDFLKTLESNCKFLIFIIYCIVSLIAYYYLVFTLQKIDAAVMQQLIEADDHQDKDYDSPSKPTSASSSSNSSTFSVVEDDKAKFLKQDQEIEELKQALAKV
ncbi:uncharacterized protein EV154DRAFT_421878 [Mucor mucedo]|uniref:uncharacterized protein n=1 Tax=Mucor mucedo TaxID=29922 RepID=UPI002220BD31|nr:uncharacterized protein EV154DRAFT_421878 [Mucor mucedo]KAI7890527.1 hypothetical protein EV154DRAFT_421878 [Mucor mucedo]